MSTLGDWWRGVVSVFRYVEPAPKPVSKRNTAKLKRARKAKAKA